MSPMLNYIWLGLIVIGVFVAGLLGRIEGDGSIADGAFSNAKAAITLALGLVGGMMMWLGMLRLAEKGGIVQVIARAIRPIMKRLFPEVPSDHPAMGAMIMNMAANILGLGNAATPLGLKAMQELDKLNPHKGTATNAMCTFLAINTSSVTLIPATAIILVSASGIESPYAIVVPAILATLCSTIVAIIAVNVFQRMPVFRIRESDTQTEPDSASDSGDGEEQIEVEKRPISKAGWVMIVLAALAITSTIFFEFHPTARQQLLDSSGLQTLLNDQAAAKQAASELKDKANRLEAAEEKPTGWRGVFISISALMIPILFVVFVVAAFARGVRIYEDFVEGAKEGWSVALRIMPFLVAMLIALGIFRDSGALMLVQWAIAPVLDLVGFPSDLVPMALMRPLSGSGSSGILAEILTNHDLSLTIRYTAATMFGSTETTFYVLA
ncbi:MAG: nucleoside recognition domain-containing protein, partial [Verrucomicrobiota bacterium]